MSSNSSQHTAMASSSQTPVDGIGPHNTATQEPSGLQKAPMELRLRIYKLLIVPRGIIGVDEVPRAGFRTFTASGAISMRLADLWTTSPDALSLVSTSKQLFREAADFLHAETVFDIASLPAFEKFLSEIGPANAAALTRLQLNLRIPDEDENDSKNAYEMLRGMTNLKSLTVAINSHVLDVVAAQDADFRSRFATQLSLQNGHWWTEESAIMACRHLDHLRLFAWGLLGQAEDAAGKREKFKVLKTTSWMGPAARMLAGHQPGRRLQSGDYDEIAAGVVGKIEQELEAGGWFA